MNFQKFLILITAFILLTFAGCGGGAAPNANTGENNSASNANTSTPNTNGLTAPTKTPEAATTNNAPTIAPVVQAYYDALKKKDDAAMKKVLSAEFIKSLQTDMKEEKETSLTKFMSTDIVPDKPVEVRNEKIDGNVAIAEIKGGSYVNWTAFKFVKEDGQWKYTNEYPDITAVKQSANTAATNSAK